MWAYMRDRLFSAGKSLVTIVVTGAFIVGASFSANAGADKDVLKLAIQPILSEQKTQEAFQPLADYLSKITGKTVVISTMPNFLAYWEIVRKGDSYELVLDAAHFTDYRASKLGFKVLAKIPDAVSYSLVTREDELLFDPTELVAKRIATLGPPSIGAARLANMFPNPMRQPIIVEARSSEDALQMLLKGKVTAAVLPTPIVFRQMSTEGGLNVVLATESVPHIAVSASPNMDNQMVLKIRAALISADKTPEGKAMLKGIGFAKFDPANKKIYAGQAKMLQEYWGF